MTSGDGLKPGVPSLTRQASKGSAREAVPIPGRAYLARVVLGPLGPTGRLQHAWQRKGSRPSAVLINTPTRAAFNAIAIMGCGVSLQLLRLPLIRDVGGGHPSTSGLGFPACRCGASMCPLQANRLTEVHGMVASLLAASQRLVELLGMPASSQWPMCGLITSHKSRKPVSSTPGPDCFTSTTEIHPPFGASSPSTLQIPSLLGKVPRQHRWRRHCLKRRFLPASRTATSRYEDAHPKAHPES